MMKHLFAFWLLCLPLAADPITSGRWSIDAQPIDEQRARLEACWRQSRENNEDGPLWRALIDDEKVQLGTHQELGPLESDLNVEQSWQNELPLRRASLTVAVPNFHGWSTGVGSDFDLTQWGQTQLRGWVSTPEWRGWSARVEASGQLEPELLDSPSVWNTKVMGRLCRRLFGGQLQLEAEEQRSWQWQRRWLTRYLYEFNGTLNFSAQGGRRWGLDPQDYQDEVQASLELRF